MELQTLHEMIQQTVATLITDPQSLVRQTLLENGITKLCVFFGKQKGVFLTTDDRVLPMSLNECHLLDSLVGLFQLMMFCFHI